MNTPVAHQIRSRLKPLSFLAMVGFTLLSPAARADTNLVWSDEFNGTSLQTNYWGYDIDNGFWVPNPGYWVGGWGNSELEYYTSRTNNVYVADGMLHIHAQQESFGGQNYTSGRIKTQNLFTKKYGRFEFRAKLPSGKGLWPAIWMLPQSSPYGGWPNSGEIDIMENNGGTSDREGGTIHFGGANGNDVFFGSTYFLQPGDSVTNFHTYTLEWNTNSMKWYVDGSLYQTRNNWWSNVGTTTNTYPFPAPFDQPFYILLNLAIGGNYLGNPAPSQINPNLPAEMIVDYVRVYDQSAPLILSTTPQPDGSTMLSWPTNIICHLQGMTNTDGSSVGAWADLNPVANPLTIVPDPNQAAVFFRLVSP